MTLAVEQEADVRRLHYAEHWPVGTIASQLGIHPDAVKRVLGLLEPRAPAPPRPRLVDTFRPFIGGIQPEKLPVELRERQQSATGAGASGSRGWPRARSTGRRRPTRET